jgi:hypothetical protein
MNCFWLRNVAVALACLGPAVAAQAAFVTPDAGTGTTGPLGWMRGDGNTTYQEWDEFTVAQGPSNAPDVADNNTNGSASLTQTETGDFTAAPPIIGPFLTTNPSDPNNIYSFDVATAFVVDVPEFGNTGNFTRVMAQFETAGTEIEYSNLLLGGAAPDYTEEVSRTVEMGGDPMNPTTLDVVEYLAIWDLADNPSSLNVTFNAAGTSMSLREVAIDTANQSTAFAALPSSGSNAGVPEPSTVVALGALIGLALPTVSRRRQRGAVKK